MSIFGDAFAKLDDLGASVVGAAAEVVTAYGHREANKITRPEQVPDQTPAPQINHTAAPPPSFFQQNKRYIMAGGAIFALLVLWFFVRKGR